MPIFDQGYQHWQGPLSGHAWRWLAIARHGVRVQMKNRVVRMFVLLAWLPALALIVAVALWGMAEQQSQTILGILQNFLPPKMLEDPRNFRATAWTLAYSLFFKTEMSLIMLLVAVAGPGLISRDLRFNALPLYFARPLTRLDYFLGKLGVIGALVGAVAVGPAVFAYVVGVSFSLDLSVVKDTYPVLLGAVAYGLVITLSAGTLILAMSSLSRRSLYVGIAWAGLWLISSAVGGILTELHRDSVRRGLLDEGLATWLAENPPPPGVRMYGRSPAVRYDHATTQVRPLVAVPDQQAKADRWYRGYEQASQRGWAKVQTAEGEAVRKDWRPVCAYTVNLDRLGEQLLGTDAAWVAIGKAAERPRQALGGFGPHGFGAPPPPTNERMLADRMAWQFPWQWSAGVLLGLLGLSAWIMTRRVKSLDRLK